MRTPASVFSCLQNVLIESPKETTAERIKRKRKIRKIMNILINLNSILVRYTKDLMMALRTIETRKFDFK